MGDAYQIPIIGAGPAGLSAAARTARLARDARHVMDEPGFLDLRSEGRFSAGSREAVLQSWADDLTRLGLNIHHGAAVSAVVGEKGSFNPQQFAQAARSVQAQS